MIRNIIKIDQDKCIGCGLCASACHEGAIGMVDGKAQLLRDDYCDGLGNCLPVCPTGAISFENREAAPFDDAGTKPAGDTPSNSQLKQWPVQIKLVPANAPYFDGADLLIAADCTAFAYGDFHNEFMKGKVTLIGCPKLDAIDYADKLTEIIKTNNIKSVTVVKMEVPCCNGIELATRSAMEGAGKIIPWSIITVSTEGHILHRT